MIKAKKAAIAALACTMVLGGGSAVFAGCKSCKPDKHEAPAVHEDILNGGFEQGDLTGWNAAGDYAFDAEGVVETETVEGVGITVGGKVGKYYFNGLAAANATSTGTLTSDPFTLGGTGKIGFKIGAGSDSEKCYVEFTEYGTDTVLKKVSNDAYDAGFIDDDLVRVVVDLSEHIGKDIYIKVTDSGSAQKSHEYLHLDDFVMYKTDAEVVAAEAERSSYIKMYAKPVFENDTPEAKTIKNGNFEDGLNNWQILEGDAYTPKAIQPSTNKFWNTREYNAEGDYFLDGFAVGEDRAGAIRSTTFTLGGTGIISFLLSSANHDTIYVAVCADEAIGDIAKDTELFKVSAKEVFKDNELSENMLRRYINASSYTPEGGEAVSLLGKKLYIKLVDGRDGGDFGAVCFDDVRCSMTEEEVLALEKADYEWAMALTDRGAEEIKYTQNYYVNYNYPIALPIMRFTDKAVSDALKTSQTPVDLTEYIKNVAAAYGDADAAEIICSITKVEYNGKDDYTDFGHFVLETAGIATVTYQAKYKDIAITETFRIEVTDANNISNGGFELGNLAGWTVSEGEVNVANAVSGAEYGWTSASYNQGGKYHLDGVNCAPEDKTYALKSTEFVLGGAGVISFKLGGRAATLRVYDATSGVCLAEYKNTAWNDESNPHVENGCRNLTMTSYYADLSAYLGFTLYIELADTETSGWGVAHFDDIKTYYDGNKDEVLAELADKEDAVHVSCKWDDNGEAKEHEDDTAIAWVAAVNNITPDLVRIIDAPKNIYLTGAQTAYNLEEVINSIGGAVIGQSQPNITKTVVSVTNVKDNPDYSKLELAIGKHEVTYKFVWNNGTEDIETEATLTLCVISENEIVNGGFETGDLTGWTYASDDGEIDAANVVRTEDTFWGERIPLNKKGEYMFNGMGDYIPEGWKYHLTSTTFTLGGSGYISFRMGGNAAVVKVFKADGTQIAEYKNTEFADKEFPHVEKGGRWATMTTFVADLSEYLGERLYIELHDTKESGWGIATFDDVVTYYENAPVVEDMYDDVTIYCEDAEGSNYQMPWVEAVNEYNG